MQDQKERRVMRKRLSFAFYFFCMFVFVFFSGLVWLCWIVCWLYQLQESKNHQCSMPCGEHARPGWKLVEGWRACVCVVRVLTVLPRRCLGRLVQLLELGEGRWARPGGGLTRNYWRIDKKQKHQDGGRSSGSPFACSP